MDPHAITDLRLGLDHLGAIVGDLEAGAAQWERLGFRLSPASRQQGRVGGVDLGVWGTANRLAVFRRGYLELIGTVDPNGPNPWKSLVDRFEGYHIVALRCDSADAAYALLDGRASGLNPPVDRSRELTSGGGRQVVRFRNIFSQDDIYPEGRFIIIEHQTPDLIWQASWQDHPNGALALEGAILCADEPAETASRMAVFSGGRSTAIIDHRYDIRLAEGGVISVCTADALERSYGTPAPPLLPAMAGAIVVVSSLDVTAECLRRNGVAVRCMPLGLVVDRAAANGGCLIFKEDAAAAGPLA